MNIIYMLENKQKQKFYIGQKVECRVEEVNGLRTIINNKTELPYYGSSSNIDMQRDLLTDKFEAHVLEIVNDKTKMCEREEYYIRQHKAVELDIDAVLEGPESIYFPETIKTKTVQEIKEHYSDIKVNVPVYHKDDEPNFDKFTAWYTPEDDIESFKDAFKDDLEYIQRAEDFIEVVPKDCSKATGIQTFIDLIGASIDDCISIGDSTNDLPMLTYTKESVAMGNSNPVLFDYVTYITTDIEADGIYNALKHFNVI